MKHPDARSFGSILAANRGIGPGFDFLRLFLSTSILCAHSVAICYGLAADHAAWQGPFRGLLGSLLPAFFGVSGFLVTASALRARTLAPFLILRALRILPALTTEIVVSALVIGPLFTDRTLRHYFTDKMFLTYFGSLVGRIRYALPGVFDQHPIPFMNTSLWTIRPELGCYIFFGILLFSGLVYRLRWTTLLGLVMLAANIVLDVQAWRVGEVRTSAPDRELLLAVTLGILFYCWRDRVPYHRGLFIVSLMIGIGFIQSPALSSVALIGLIYAILFVGLTRIPKIPLYWRGDYSYGIYLYGFPIQQMMFALFPAARAPLVNILFAFPVVSALAMMSWHLVERPALGLRKRLVRPAPAQIPRQNRLVFGSVLLTMTLYALYLSGTVIEPDATFDTREALYIGAMLASLTATIIILRARWHGGRPDRLARSMAVGGPA